jgi:glucosamine 6-phosphate synthetase-like amidotransferase/phosphosugar isomerase protein
MCKVLFIAGIKKQHQEKVKKLLKAAAGVMSKSPDNDGVGYAGITDGGKIYGEKWISPEQAFKIHSAPKPPESLDLIKDLIGDAGEFKENAAPSIYDSFGNKKDRKNTVAVILHTRNATVGGKSIQNTHPFVALNEDNVDTALIHNGTILNHADLTKKTSTCDSEVILHEYLKNGMNYNPWSITNLAKAFRGTYTAGVLSSYMNGEEVVPILDIFKSNKDLYVGYCPQIETAIFSTEKGQLESMTKEAGMTIETLTEVKSGFLIRLNAVTGVRQDDLISFECSPQYISAAPYTAPTAKPYGEGVKGKVEVIDNEKEVSVIKGNFATRHQHLFNHDYKNLNLTSEEQKIFDTIKNKGNANLKALQLVKMTISGDKA